MVVIFDIDNINVEFETAVAADVNKSNFLFYFKRAKIFLSYHLHLLGLPRKQHVG